MNRTCINYLITAKKSAYFMNELKIKNHEFKIKQPESTLISKPDYYHLFFAHTITRLRFYYDQLLHGKNYLSGATGTSNRIIYPGNFYKSGFSIFGIPKYGAGKFAFKKLL